MRHFPRVHVSLYLPLMVTHIQAVTVSWRTLISRCWKVSDFLSGCSWFPSKPICGVSESRLSREKVYPTILLWRKSTNHLLSIFIQIQIPIKNRKDLAFWFQALPNPNPATVAQVFKKDCISCQYLQHNFKIAMLKKKSNEF